MTTLPPRAATPGERPARSPAGCGRRAGAGAAIARAGRRGAARGVLGLALLAALLSGPAGAQDVTGAGSTLAHPILQRWSQMYQRSQADAEFQPVGQGLDYEPVGSQAGVLRVRAGAVDFGATDAPLSGSELERLGLAQFPFVIGGIVVAVNVAGVPPGRLRLTGALLADIYLGEVTRWSDPAIRALNPELSLPDAPIAVLRRSDGSGTTFNFTNFLGKSSPRWRERVGEGLLVSWPLGAEAKGNDGMADALRRTPNALGYLDFAQSRAAGLSHALVRNGAGAYVAPGPDSFRAAASAAGEATGDGSGTPLTDAPGAGVYPIVATTFAVMPRRPAGGASRARATLAFFRWSFENGAPAAAELGYVALPRDVVERVTRGWAAMF